MFKLVLPPSHLRVDGVINIDYGYVSRWQDFKFIPGAIDGMRLFQDHGYLLIVVTNQSGIARGLFNSDDYHKLTDAYRSYLHARGVGIDGVYHCPHHPEFPDQAIVQSYDCRKPKPGLIIKAALNHNIRLCDSVLIGDKTSDILSAYNAGIPTRYLVSSKSYSELIASQVVSYVTCSSLFQCAQAVLD